MQVDRLLALQKRHGGVIELDTKTAQQLLGGKSRPYSVIIVAGETAGGSERGCRRSACSPACAATLFLNS
jgi:hypothetical protein